MRERLQHAAVDNGLLQQPVALVEGFVVAAGHSRKPGVEAVGKAIKCPSTVVGPLAHHREVFWCEGNDADAFGDLPHVAHLFACQCRAASFGLNPHFDGQRPVDVIGALDPRELGAKTNELFRPRQRLQRTKRSRQMHRFEQVGFALAVVTQKHRQARVRLHFDVSQIA